MLHADHRPKVLLTTSTWSPSHGTVGVSWVPELSKRMVAWALLVLVSAIYCIHLNYMQVDAISRFNERQITYQRLRHAHQQLVLRVAEAESRQRIEQMAQQQLGMKMIAWHQRRHVPLV